MDLGIFMMPLHPPSRLAADTYDEDAELLMLADELGFVEAFIGEHGTMRWENIPAPDQFIASVAARTRQIRFGTGVVLMAQHHPANTANRLAQLDHLTRGRLIFGAGTGGITTDVELFGLDPNGDEIGRRMMRALDLILKFWTEEPPYDYPGEFWPMQSTGGLLGPAMRRYHNIRRRGAWGGASGVHSGKEIPSVRGNFAAICGDCVRRRLSGALGLGLNLDL